MGREFDGVDDRIAFGNDASVNNFDQRTWATWVQNDRGNNVYNVTGVKGAGGGALQVARQAFVDPDKIEVFYDFDGATNGTWRAGTGWTTQLMHLVVTYDRTSTANDPVIYEDGASQAVTEVTTPAGTAISDADGGLTVGTDNASASDWDGRQMAFCYDNTIWDAAMVNRHKWWGVAPGGPSTVKVWHPLWTDALLNKGTAVADGTATGTTMIAIPKCERMWGMMMGCGR